MGTVGIRELKQNASAVVARAAAGEILTVTDRGRPVAHLTPLAGGTLQGLIDAGLARPAKISLADLPAPSASPDAPNLTDALTELRDGERY